MRNRTVLATLVVAGLGMTAAWRAETQPRAPILKMEGDRIEVTGGAPHGYLVVTMLEKGAVKAYAYELGPTLVCIPGSPCEQCKPRAGCVQPPVPIVDPTTCPQVPGIPCIRGVFGASAPR
jgi:hypothetical protein